MLPRKTLRHRLARLLVLFNRWTWDPPPAHIRLSPEEEEAWDEFFARQY